MSSDYFRHFKKLRLLFHLRLMTLSIFGILPICFVWTIFHLFNWTLAQNYHKENHLRTSSRPMRNWNIIWKCFAWEWSVRNANLSGCALLSCQKSPVSRINRTTHTPGMHRSPMGNPIESLSEANEWMVSLQLQRKWISMRNFICFLIIEKHKY